MRDHILARVREAARAHSPVPHPGPLGADALSGDDARAAFAARFTAAGGEVVRAATAEEAAALAARLAPGCRTAAIAAAVPPALRPPLEPAPPERADLAISLARCAVAETGSLLLDSREGRRLQLLAPTHLVLVPDSLLVPTLAEALALTSSDRGAALALHSGPSKSADIAGTLVHGVHGPGRLIAAFVPDTLLQRPV